MAKRSSLALILEQGKQLGTLARHLSLNDFIRDRDSVRIIGFPDCFLDPFEKPSLVCRRLVSSPQSLGTIRSHFSPRHGFLAKSYSRCSSALLKASAASVQMAPESR